MTDQPDISIVLPAYKAVDHINRVVPEMMDAVSTLGHSIEVVLVVNGPDDGTDAAAYVLRDKDPRVQVLRADEPGWGRGSGWVSAPRRETCSRTRTWPARRPRCCALLWRSPPRFRGPW